MEPRRPSGSLGIVCWLALGAAVARAQAPVTVASPDGKNQVTVGLREGVAYYAVDRGGKHVILPSRLGFDFRGASSLGEHLRVVGSRRGVRDTTWALPWGEVARVREHYNELRVTFGETAAPGRQFTVAVRAFDDGIGFRYEVADSGGLADFEISDERTEFH